MKLVDKNYTPEPANTYTLDELRELHARRWPGAVASEMNFLRDQVAAFRREMSGNPSSALVAFHCELIREILAELETLCDVDPDERPHPRSFPVASKEGAP